MKSVYKLGMCVFIKKDERYAFVRELKKKGRLDHVCVEKSNGVRSWHFARELVLLSDKTNAN